MSRVIAFMEFEKYSRDGMRGWRLRRWDTPSSERPWEGPAVVMRLLSLKLKDSVGMIEAGKLTKWSALTK